MSKKIASGADKIVLDVKVGNGALLKNDEQAQEAKRVMKMIGDHYNKQVEIMITYMDIPLGIAIGNSLEILEVIRILKNEENNYLVALSKALASKMVEIALGVDEIKAKKMVDESLTSGKAYEKFKEIIKAQNGDLDGIKVSTNTQEIYSTQSGKVVSMDAYSFGKLSLDLGGGRVTKEDKIDNTVGIILNKKVGDIVEVGDLLCTLYLKENAPKVDTDVESFYKIK